MVQGVASPKRLKLWQACLCGKPAQLLITGVRLVCSNLSYFKQLGPATVVIAVDVRSERSREVVLEPPSWAELFHRAGGLPRGVKHAVVMLPPPLHYPRVRTPVQPAQGK